MNPPPPRAVSPTNQSNQRKRIEMEDIGVATVTIKLLIISLYRIYIYIYYNSITHFNTNTVKMRVTDHSSHRLKIG